jgi:hypothetical protein
MNRRPHTNRHAFTLIELVASALLAAMLMMALLNIAWSAHRESNALRRASAGDFPFAPLADRMRIDFYNARGMLVDAGGVTLHGFVAEHPYSRQPLLLPGRVRYAAHRIGNRTVLTRRWQDRSAEPVWYGFLALRIEPLAEPDPQEDSWSAEETGGLPPVPLSFRVTLLGDHNRILWQEVIHHHDS